MNHEAKKGFTIIELLLAMTFVGVLLLSIALTTIQISHIYNKGITIREVNQVGRAISTELQRSIAGAAPFDVTLGAANTKYVSVTDGGRLCVGRYSYAWNYGKSLRNNTPANTYSTGFSSIGFVKVSDSGGALCANPAQKINRADATEMLSAGDRQLALHKLSIARTANDVVTGQAIYAISLTIGTNDETQLTSNDLGCVPPSDGQGNEDYCSVNQFDIVARAGTKSGGN